MRISDWSSDVCSSDLAPCIAVGNHGRDTRGGQVGCPALLAGRCVERAKASIITGSHEGEARLGDEHATERRHTYRQRKHRAQSHGPRVAARAPPPRPKALARRRINRPNPPPCHLVAGALTRDREAGVFTTNGRLRLGLDYYLAYLPTPPP